MLSNPGSVRISIKEAINGGISDPRNGIMLKIFSLIEFGERAGSGLSGICKVWEKVYHTPATIEETHNNGVDRTTLTLSKGGNDQDVKAMLELYGDLVDPNAPQSGQETTQTDRNTTQTTTQTDKNIPHTRVIESLSIQDQIIQELKKNPNLSRKDLAKTITSVTEAGIKYHLKKLREKGLLRRVGPDFGGHWEILKQE